MEREPFFSKPGAGAEGVAFRAWIGRYPRLARDYQRHARKTDAGTSATRLGAWLPTGGVPCVCPAPAVQMPCRYRAAARFPPVVV